MENVDSNFTKVSELRTSSRGVNLRVHVLNVLEPRSVFSRYTGERHTVTEALVGDDTGTVLLTLWDKDGEKVEVGKTYDLRNVRVTVFKNSIRLSLGRNGEISESSVEISEDSVNKDNNVSEKVVTRSRGYY